MKCECCENCVLQAKERGGACGETMKVGPTYKRKIRAVYVVLGFFLGAIGVHNYYAGYKYRAATQLLITVVSLGYLLIVSWIWAIVEIIIVDHDAHDRLFV